MTLRDAILDYQWNHLKAYDAECSRLRPIFTLTTDVSEIWEKMTFLSYRLRRKRIEQLKTLLDLAFADGSVNQGDVEKAIDDLESRDFVRKLSSQFRTKEARALRKNLFIETYAFFRNFRDQEGKADSYEEAVRNICVGEEYYQELLRPLVRATNNYMAEVELGPIIRMKDRLRESAIKEIFNGHSGEKVVEKKGLYF